MASISPPRDADDRRSGGKILRPRRTAAPKTPYDRPPPNSPPRNPNWLSKLVLSPTRMIASGAGKILSAFRSDYSSSSSSDEDSSSEGDSDDANDDTGVSSQDANQLEKFHSFGKDPQAIEWKSETKRAIERLLLQETFSREECDRLTHIIQSRVVDPPLTSGIDGNRVISNDVDKRDLHSAAVTEAKRWLEVKKLRSNTKPQQEYGMNSAVSPHATEGEIGSPVDLAKSYMRERPPWSSPSMKDMQLKSPSFTGTQLFKEDSPYLRSGLSVSASKLFRDSPSTGVWNITEEIRKVRSKATEDLLRTRPSLITDFSALASDDERSPGLLVADIAESVSQIAQDGILNQASPLDPAASNSHQTQDLVAIRITEEAEERGLSLRESLQPSQSNTAAAADGANDIGGAGQPLNTTTGEDPRDSSLHKISYSTLVEVTVVDGPVATNGFPSPRSSLHAGQEEETSKLPSKPTKLASSGHENNNTSSPVDGTSEVPNENGNNGEVTVSQNSSDIQHEEEALDEDTLPQKRKATTEKQQEGRRRSVRKKKGAA